MRFTVLTSISVIAAALTLGPVGAQAPPYKSPADVFAAAKRAAEKEDMKALLSCLTEESRDMMAGGLAFVGVMLKAFAAFGKEDTKELVAALDATMKKHGLTEDALAKLKGAPPIDPKNPEAIKKMMLSFIAPVRDRSAFVLDMFKVMKEHGKDGKKDKGFLAPDAELKELKIENDRAKAVIVSKQAGQEKREPIEFRRIGGSWLMELPVDQFKIGPGLK